MAQDREQDHAGCKQPEAQLLCVNNCGFFGCPATMNLCSKCYREVRFKVESQSPVKSFGEKNPIMLTALVEKTLSKGPLSGRTQTAENPQNHSVSVASLPSSPEHLPSQAGLPSASSADIFKPAEPIEGIEGTIKTQQESFLTVTNLVVAQQAQSSGSSRCISCRKRVGLLVFKCRCGGVFCAAHRYSDKHGCSFDYKAAGRDAIAKANPVVRAEKVERI